MEFIRTEIPEVIQIKRAPIGDSRGYFERFFCEMDFSKAGVSFQIAQSNFSFNATRGTLRGLHYQADPKPEAKVVWCEKGRIFDVAVDIRRESPTFGKWVGRELSAEDHQMLYIPSGFAHGFQTLEADTKVGYLMSEFYCSDMARGVRWNDPEIGIRWPLLASVTLSDRDTAHPFLRELR